jgi:transposase-like protein
MIKIYIHMGKRIFTKEQIKILLENSNVSQCSDRMIVYDNKFKVKAVGKYNKGLSPSEIFRESGFDLDMVGHTTPKESLRRWLRTYKEKGEKGLLIDRRITRKNGGRPKDIKTLIKNLPDKEKVRRLEAEVSYLKEENRFLAKLRKES